ncbi:MAG: ribosome biogenesis GTPase YlqF [Pseudanabaenaceae cyanobacterium SKYGB_i_bin29]|nr:ribosome biogenesis GTPase YlqF [Pseudanabaenaceae cyanobacterium SKYG29]MDW8422351.1 ribosome biogenesis GTPase YlqF [Pseudanabaenaceae cyanobacterium SKYGB_i_bin29]
MALIQWYPGHIAKAEAALKEQLKLVDLVLEVRDARIPRSSANPRLREWSKGKHHLCILNRIDLIGEELLQQWYGWFRAQEMVVYGTNGQTGEGVAQLMQAAQQVGIAINQKRQQRGMLPRPVRAVVVGYPNVGKSALINRLLKRRVAPSANKPGVTRQLRWIRISEQIELLDTPGILPPRLEDQNAALKLAICDDIGQAAYDPISVSSALLDMLRELGVNITDRYNLNLEDFPSGADYLVALSAKTKQQQERTAQQILHDFRRGRLGKIGLEYPPN